ncbi:MAG: hypothetical protein OEM01_11185 [Desulfobulbaceae bacterium]|nr:hypothetical protein [Desulfobulbaceae bacterium]
MKLKVLLGLLLLVLMTGLAHARLDADYEFKDLDGKIYTPATLKGKPVVIYIGSTF